MRPLPLRTSLTLTYTTLLAALVAVVAAGSHALLVRQVDRDASLDVDELVRGLHGYLRFENGRPRLAYDPHDLDAAAFVEDATRYYQVYDAAGHLLVQSPGFAAAGVDYTPAEVAAYRARHGEHDVETDRGRLRISSSVITPTPGESYLLQVGLPLDRMDRSIASLERALLWGAALALLLSVGIGRWMSGRALVPLSRLAHATRDIDITTLSRRLPGRGTGDELDEVTAAFNQALDRVDRAVAEMRQFSAALAHELRTPLAVLRGETELALTAPGTPEPTRQRLATVLEEFDRLNGLITQILTLARAEAGQITLARESVDLADVATNAVADFESLATAAGLTLDCTAGGPATVAGDAAWLERLLIILLDNAIAFTPRGGQVTVTVSRTHDGPRLEVADTGIGIESDALPHLFERFYRADPARTRRATGAGLGLALAQWIADRHHARISVVSRPGHGSTFSVVFPVEA